MKKKIKFLVTTALTTMLLTGTLSAETVNTVKGEKELIYLNAEKLNYSKEQIELENSVYTDAYDSLIAIADAELEKGFDPVTNKTIIPPSGDIHDYYSIAPYAWPNPDTEDGRPWIIKDGQINPMTRGADTDFTRSRDMFVSLETLAMAYYFSDDEKYINRAKDIIDVWFIDEETKVNPNINFGQGLPGPNNEKSSGLIENGRPSGIIEWACSGNLVTAVQILEKAGLLDESEQAVLDEWFSDYLTWLTTSEHGIGADNSTNNHGSNYDYQVLGLMIYLDRIDEAEARLEDLKTKRIEHHLAADGSQPHELWRTKSVNYTVNNLWAITKSVDLGLRFTDVDLWSYKSKEGINLKLGYDFVIPYMLGEKEWKWEQIEGGGAEKKLESMAKPMFRRTELMLGQEILPSEINAYNNFGYKDILIYAPPITAEQELIYLNAERLNQSKKQVKANNSIYVDAYDNLIAAADVELEKGFDPVTNKTIIPPSGDKHDYYSLAPYSWPNPDTEDGLPWIGKDGQVNPLTRGSDTDFTRLRDMFASLDKLTMAYYFSDDEKYIKKAKDIINVWFINEETKVNPNINFGQGVPGYHNGRRSGVIEWVSIGSVVTAVQVLEKAGLLDESEQSLLDNWFNDYFIWLTTSELGVAADNTLQNHGSNYDYQAVGLMIYLGKIDEAKARLEDIKTRRIEHHLAADGSQPHELRRTKSVNYTVNNLWAIARTVDLGLRFTDVDLWAYESEEGINLKLGYDFAIPYMLGEKKWEWEQITGDGAESQLHNWALPMFSRTELMLGQEILPSEINAYDNFDYKDILIYAPHM